MGLLQSEHLKKKKKKKRTGLDASGGISVQVGPHGLRTADRLNRSRALAVSSDSMPGVYVFGVRRSTSRELLEQDRTEEQQCEEHQQHLAEKNEHQRQTPLVGKTLNMRLLRYQGLEQRSLNVALVAATSDT